MIHLGLSGGGTRGIFHLAVVNNLLSQGIKFNVISGISVGAVLALPIAMAQENKEFLRSSVETFLNLKLSTFFSSSPVNKRGRFTIPAILRVVTGKDYLGKQDNLKKTLGRLITQDTFTKYKRGNYPDIWVGMVHEDMGDIVYVNLKNLDYEEFLKAVNASASIPIFTKHQMLWSKRFVDGGLVDHNPTPTMLLKYPEITESYSVYLRPRDFKLKPYRPRGWFKILDRLLRTIDVFSQSVSRADEIQEDIICQYRGIKQVKYFAPEVMNSPYDTDPSRLALLFRAGSVAQPVINENELLSE